jgi:SAM-dependent methyltransferase
MPGNAVLDIGCGAGELALALARARPQARVVGLDISPELIEVAAQRGQNLPNVEFALGDAASWSQPGFAPDLLVSRHGVMFFGDPAGAFRHLHETAAPGASLVFSCFRSVQENPWAADIARMIDQPPGDPHAPGPFAFADPLRVERLLEAAGWQSVAFEPADFAYIAGHGDDPVAEAQAFFSRIGPAARALRQLEGEAKEQFAARMTRWLKKHCADNLVAFGAAAWIVSARRG